MGLMAFGANEPPIEHSELVELLFIFLCQGASALLPFLELHPCGLPWLSGERRKGLGEFRILLRNIERRGE